MIVSKEQIAQAQAKIKSLNEEAEKYHNLIDTVQKLCQHEWVTTGAHGHNDSEYRCNNCTKTVWE